MNGVELHAWQLRGLLAGVVIEWSPGTDSIFSEFGKRMNGVKSFLSDAPESMQLLLCCDRLAPEEAL